MCRGAGSRATAARRQPAGATTAFTSNYFRPNLTKSTRGSSRRRRGKKKKREAGGRVGWSAAEFPLWNLG